MITKVRSVKCKNLCERKRDTNTVNPHNIRYILIHKWSHLLLFHGNKRLSLPDKYSTKN